MNSQKIRIGSFLKRVKDQINIENSTEYKRITIKTKHQGITIRNISKGILIGTKLQFTVKTGQFLLSKIDARLGAFGIVPDTLNGGIITGNFWAFDVNNKIVNIEWFNLFTSSGNFYEICNQASSGTTHRKYLDEIKFLNFEIFLPDIDYQNNFVKRYNAFKNNFELLSSEIEKQQDHIQQLRQTILQEAVQGKLVQQSNKDESACKLLQQIKTKRKNLGFTVKLKKEENLLPITKDEIPFELPEGWVWCRLGELINVGSSKRIYASDYKITGIPFYRSMEIGLLGENKEIKIELFISELKFRQIKEKYGVPKSGDILIACIGGSIGNTWVVDERTFYYKDGNLVLLESIPELNTNYLLLYLKSDLFIQSAMDRVLGSAYNALTIIKIKNSLIPLPPFSEQNRIVAKIQQLQQIINELSQEIKNNKYNAQQLLRALLENTINGDKNEHINNEPLTILADQKAAHGLTEQAVYIRGR